MSRAVPEAPAGIGKSAGKMFTRWHPASTKLVYGVGRGAFEKGSDVKVRCTGVAVVEHARTGERFEISAGELDWDQEGHAERQMGAEIRHWADLEHDELGILAWSIYEYPVGVENYRETDVGEHKLLEDVSYALEHERREQDEE